jgi:uncharacterized protein (TIGR03435 family)
LALRFAGFVLRLLFFALTLSTLLVAQRNPDQPAPPQPIFEVASIRAHPSSDPLTNRFDLGRGGKFTASNCSLRLLIRWAYNVLSSQLTGAPNWVGSEGWDIAAKGGGDAQVDEFRMMVQRLLEERFRLRYHWETKEAPVFHLVVGKAVKLRENTVRGDCPSIFSDGPSTPTGAFPGAPCGGLMNSPGHTQGNKLTAGELARDLSFFLDSPVLDKTGLTGKYDIELRWTPERILLQSSTPPDAASPSIFTAIQEQLGLKLESAKGRVRSLVIDTWNDRLQTELVSFLAQID